MPALIIALIIIVIIGGVVKESIFGKFFALFSILTVGCLIIKLITGMTIFMTAAKICGVLVVLTIVIFMITKIFNIDL